jgi:signal transduction histidine kinase
MPTRVNKDAQVDRVLSTSEKGLARLQPDSLDGSILGAMRDGISVHLASGEITWVNSALSKMYGKPLSELKGLSCGQVFHAESPSCPHEQVLATGQAEQLLDEFGPSGRVFSVRIEPLFEGENKPCGFVRVVHDVTRERHLSGQLLKAEQYATLGQLLFGITHDLGTPLNVILGYAEFLLMHTKPEDRGYKELTSIRDQTRRIAAMFAQVVDLARPARGQSGAIDLQTLMSSSLALIGHNLRQTGVTAGLTCRINSPLIYGEAPQLRQAVFNLLLNAGQHIGAGGTFQVVIEEAMGKPGFVRLAFLGTEASGIAHDFSISFAILFGSESEIGTAGIGLHLTRRILEDAGATTGLTEAGEQGVGLAVYLPVDGCKRSDDH